MNKDFTFTIKRIGLNENYHPSNNTRITTNFANLARGNSRQQNLRNTLKMIDNSFNALAYWDNPKGDRYSVELEIISVDIDIEGIVGNNFSSYVRDYDFSVLLSEHNKGQAQFSIPERFGDLHGKIFKNFVNSSTYKQHFKKTPVICLSVSDNKTYHRTDNQHPLLGVEYQPSESSLTEQYFKKMGLQVRYFMPPKSVAPLAFFFFGDLLNDYSNLELISTISTMETFQKIYRPEIYNANAVAGNVYQPNLKNQDHSLTKIFYDKEERSKLAIKQGKFAEENFIKPYQKVLNQWSENYAL